MSDDVRVQDLSYGDDSLFVVDGIDGRVVVEVERSTEPDLIIVGTDTVERDGYTRLKTAVRFTRAQAVALLQTLHSAIGARPGEI